MAQDVTIPGGVLLFSPSATSAQITALQATDKGLVEGMYAEGADHPKMMSLALHDRLTGRPGRITGLVKFLDHVTARDRVWMRAAAFDDSEKGVWAAHFDPARVPFLAQ